MRSLHNNTNAALVQEILHEMQAQIVKYNLELMRHYPDDLLVHDKAALERVAVPGAMIAWMCGNLHTHIVPLGLHKEENKMVECLVNMGSEDRFFVINISQAGKFKFTEVKRAEFGALSNTPVPYECQGSVSDFWLYRHKTKIGHVALKQVGNYQESRIAGIVTPVSGITGNDQAALELGCEQAITKMAGSLFRKSEVTWAEPIELAKAA